MIDSEKQNLFFEPNLNKGLKELEKSDFLPFQALCDQKFAMTAHILFTAIDKDLCATLSPKAIDLIRNKIGFKNILMSDDLSMKALGGSFANRTELALKAGCDLILHCNGNMNEMKEINSALPILSDQFKEKLK